MKFMCQHLNKMKIINAQLHLHNVELSRLSLVARRCKIMEMTVMYLWSCIMPNRCIGRHYIADKVNKVQLINAVIWMHFKRRVHLSCCVSSWKRHVTRPMRREFEQFPLELSHWVWAMIRASSGKKTIEERAALLKMNISDLRFCSSLIFY